MEQRNNFFFIEQIIVFLIESRRVKRMYIRA